LDTSIGATFTGYRIEDVIGRGGMLPLAITVYAVAVARSYLDPRDAATRDGHRR
jgi:hypothetical protein